TPAPWAFESVERAADFAVRVRCADRHAVHQGADVAIYADLKARTAPFLKSAIDDLFPTQRDQIVDALATLADVGAVTIDSDTSPYLLTPRDEPRPRPSLLADLGVVAPSTRLCLSARDFGTAIPRQEALALLDAFVAQGGAFIDTASAYPWIPGHQGASE